VLEKVTAQITEDENVPNELIKPLEHFIGEYMRACEDGSEGGDVAENIVKVRFGESGEGGRRRE